MKLSVKRRWIYAFFVLLHLLMLQEGCHGDQKRAPCIVCLKGTALSPQEKALLQQHRPIGVMLLTANCASEAQVKALTQEIHALGILVAVDIEGKLVNRLRKFYPLDKNPVDFRDTSSDEVYQYFNKIAMYTKSLGIDIIFGPVTDVSCVGSYMTERAFSDDPTLVAQRAFAVIKSYQDAGILPVVKHLPGHGKAADSHEGLPKVNASREVLLACDIKASQQVIQLVRQHKRILPAVMTAHVHYPALDPTRPATFSPVIQETWIRGRIGVGADVIVFSDSLHMGAVQEFVSQRYQGENPLAKAYALFLEAGGDIAIFGMVVREDGTQKITGTIEDLARIPNLFEHKSTTVLPKLHALLPLPLHR